MSGELAQMEAIKERLAQIAEIAKGVGSFSDIEEQDCVIDVASSGNSILIDKINSKKIRVTSVFLMASAAVNVRFLSGQNGNVAKTGQMNIDANGGFVLPYNPRGWFTCKANDPLLIELSGAVSVDGCLKYVPI